MGSLTSVTLFSILLACLHVICLNNATAGSNDNQEFQNVTDEQNISSTVPGVETTTILTPKKEVPRKTPITPKPQNSNTECEQFDRGLTRCESCTCNRTAYCDVGCCCDEDCTAEDRMSFSTCENCVPSIHQRHCLRSNIFFRNSSEYKLINATNGLFCIVPTKTESTTCYKHFEILTTTKQFNRVSAKNGNPLRTSTVDATGKLPEAKHGQPLVTEKNGEYKYLGFPSSVAGKCAGVKPVLYLMDSEATCCSSIPVAVDCEANPILNAATFYENISIIMGQKIIPIKPCICSSSECQTDVQPPVYQSLTRTCLNIVSHVQYMIMYDGSSGIKSISAFILQGQVSDRLKLQYWCQTFKVEYKKGNASDNNECNLRYSQPTITKSGNPGYVLGAPVLAGTLNGSGVNVESKFSLVQPTTSGAADCNFEIFVMFGESQKFGCTLSVTNLQSLGTVCNRLTQITSQLFNVTVDRIAMFGNASPSRSKDWIPLLSKTLSKMRDVSDINKLESLYFYSTCEIFTDSHLLIAVARVGHKTNPQYKIVGARLTKTKIPYLAVCRQLSCDVESHAVHVTFGVSFVDVSRSEF